MLLVKTRLDKSSIHGIGLFADQFIPKGTMVWRFEPGFDRLVPKREMEHLPGVAQDYLRTYASQEYEMYLIDGDNSRFTNHSDLPNLSTVGGLAPMIAACDIRAGEELTCNYLEFDAPSRAHEAEI